MDTEKPLLIEPCQVLPLDVTTTCDSHAWNYTMLATLLTLRESLAEVGLEPLINAQESYH